MRCWIESRTSQEQQVEHRFYRYFGGCGRTCGGSSCNGGAGNYVVVTGGSGWEFRQLHIGANASSGSKTCDRCALELVSSTGQSTGAHVGQPTL